MSRRVYFVSPRRKRLEQQALLTLRETRRALGPDTLKIAEDALLRYAGACASQTAVKNVRAGPEMVPVDMKKNLMIVAKYLQICGGNAGLLKQINTLLSESL